LHLDWRHFAAKKEEGFQAMSAQDEVNRRSFLKTATAVGSTLGLASSALAARPGAAAKGATGRVLGANDRINVGVIGCGGRGSYVAREFKNVGEKESNAQILAVCDVYEKRKAKNAEFHNVKGYLDYREVLGRDDIDAVIVATPDHWHAKIALEAMDKGKDVYLEKPMCHTIDEARMLVSTVKESKRVLQVGSQTTSADQWHQAKKAIADGMIGKMLMSQGSYHRNSVEGEWNWPIDAEAVRTGRVRTTSIGRCGWAPRPSAPSMRPLLPLPQVLGLLRRYRDDLFFHVVAPMNICWVKRSSQQGDGGRRHL